MQHSNTSLNLHLQWSIHLHTISCFQTNSNFFQPLSLRKQISDNKFRHCKNTLLTKNKSLHSNRRYSYTNPLRTNQIYNIKPYMSKQQNNSRNHTSSSLEDGSIVLSSSSTSTISLLAISCPFFLTHGRWRTKWHAAPRANIRPPNQNE